MPGLVPGIHVFTWRQIKTWMAGSSPAMTTTNRVCELTFAIPEQRREPLLAVAGKIDDAAAGGGIARGPFQLGEARHQRRAQRAREMMTPFAPVEAGLAQRPARMGERLRVDLQRVGHEARALGGQLDVVLLLTNQLLPLHAVEHLHAEIAGEMIVADPGAAQRRILRSGAHAHVAGARGQAREALEHPGDIGIGEAIVAVAALLLLLDQPAGFQFRKMRTRSAA
jgi:hypothetical protein